MVRDLSGGYNPFLVIFLAFKLSDVAFNLIINIQMPT